MCGRLGHSEKFCSAMLESPVVGRVLPYGVGLRAGRRCGGATAGNRWVVTDPVLRRAEMGLQKHVSTVTSGGCNVSMEGGGCGVGILNEFIMKDVMGKMRGMSMTDWWG